MRAARRVGSNTAIRHAVVMARALATYATGSKTSTQPPISEAAGVANRTIATAAARPPPANSPIPSSRSDPTSRDDSRGDWCRHVGRSSSTASASERTRYVNTSDLRDQRIASGLSGDQSLQTRPCRSALRLLRMTGPVGIQPVEHLGLNRIAERAGARSHPPARRRKRCLRAARRASFHFVTFQQQSRNVRP